MSLILVVDDLSTDRILAGGVLQRHAGWEVIYATNGVEALQQLELNLPDLVLTDMQMPEMDGLTLVQEIKKDYPLMPVILMTSQGSEEIAVRALEQGASSYVPKRRIARELVEVVERVLAGARAEQDVRKVTDRMRECVFSMENDPPLLSSLSRYLQQACHDRGLCTDVDRLRVGVALEEALINACYHGNLEVSSELREQGNAYQELARQRALEFPYWDRRIDVRAEFLPDRATFVIRDEGQGFDYTSLPDPTAPENLDRAYGRGVLLMRTFMDEVKYNDRGNEVTLVKLKAAEPANPDR